jgi:hypothetical protein
MRASLLVDHSAVNAGINLGAGRLSNDMPRP